MEKQEKIKHLRKERVFIEKTGRRDTIVNIPLDDNGFPIMKAMRVEWYGKVYAGWHMLYSAILTNDRGRTILREVLS